MSPLASVSAPSEYLASWRAGQILDIAPLRDLSYLLDLRLARIVGAPTFVATNLALWLLFVLLAMGLFADLGFGDGMRWILFGVLLCHPVYGVSVAWIAARKHLLAGIFALLATRQVVAPPRRGSGALAAIFYALSILSHPIHILWPVWAWSYLSLTRRLSAREIAPTLFPSGTVLLLGAASNAWYYTGPYLVTTGGIAKFSSESGPGVAIMAVGRAICNLVLPFALSPVDYFPGSAANLVGVALLPILVLVSLRTLPWRQSLPWLLYFALPLLLLNARATRVFLSDTYLLLPSLGLWVLIAQALTARPRQGRALAASLLILAIPGLLAARTIARSFFSIEELFALAYAREPTPQVAAVHAQHLLESGQFRLAAEVAYEAMPHFTAAEVTFARAVADDPSLNAGAKIELFQRVPLREPLAHYAYASVLARAGRYGEAYAEMEPGLAALSQLGEVGALITQDAHEWARRSGRREIALPLPRGASP